MLLQGQAVPTGRNTFREDKTGYLPFRWDLDRQTFLGPFVGHGQALELLAIGTSVEDEVVGPQLVGACGLGRLLATRLHGRRRGTWRRAWRHSRQARVQFMPWPSRFRKMRMHR